MADTQFDRRGLVLLLFIIATLLIGEMVPNNWALAYFGTALCAAYSATFVLVVINIGFFSLQGLAVFFIGFFGVFALPFTALGIIDATHYSSGFVDYIWSDIATKEVLASYLVLVASCCFVFLVLPERKRHSTSQRTMRCPERELVGPFLRIGKALMLTTAPLALIDCVLSALEIQESGYLSYYSGALQSIPIIQMLAIPRAAFIVGYYSVCAGNPCKRDFDRYSVLFLLVSFLGSMYGARGAFIMPVLFFFFYRYRFYGIKFTAKWIPIALVSILPLLSLYSFIRTGDAAIGLTEIANQSSSISVAALYFDYRTQLPDFGYPFILEPITKIYDYFSNMAIYSNGQSEAMIGVRNSLSHQLSYLLNPARYVSGGNIGGNMVAEMMQLGPGGCFVFSLFYCSLVRFINTYIKQSLLVRFLAYELFFQILLAPRASLFLDSYTLAKYLLIFICLALIANLFSNRFDNNSTYTNYCHETS